MLKEIIIFNEGRDDIKNLTIGIFPAKGRYYRKEMSNNGYGFFHVEVDLPLGISYYHLYLNYDFTKEYVDINTPILGQDLISRIPIIIKSEIFNHIYFENSPQFISYINKNIVELKLVSYHSWINKVKLVNENLEEFDFQVIFSNKNRKYWNLRYKIKDDENYRIKFGNDEKEYWFLENNKASLHIKESTFFTFPELPQLDFNDNTVGVGYQIFPDRYCKSDQQKENEIFQAWDSKPGTYSFFGGDIKGIIDKLKLIKELGINFIYLNPVFYSNSAHRYDTIDYTKIDPLLGTEEDFKQLVDLAHSLNLHVILDISLNHCSTDFFAFKDLLKFQNKSKYQDWFIINSFPFSIDETNYSCWHGYKELPEFNFNNSEAQNYLIESALYWIKKFDIDGWRIDVSNEIPDHFLEAFIKANREVKKDIQIIGENLHNESDDFVCKDGGDGITAYSLNQDVFNSYFIEEIISFSQLVQNIIEYIYSHSFKALKNSWTFLSNHDLPRFYFMLQNKKQYKLAFSLLHIIPGTPIYYYGEEIKLAGDVGNSRYAMNWDDYTTSSSLFLYFKKMNFIHNQYHEVFDYGNVEIPYVDKNNKILAVRRRYNGNSICFLLNFSDQDIKVNINNVIGTDKNYKILLGELSDNNNIELCSNNIVIIQSNN